MINYYDKMSELYFSPYRKIQAIVVPNLSKEEWTLTSL